MLVNNKHKSAFFLVVLGALSFFVTSCTTVDQPRAQNPTIKEATSQTQSEPSPEALPEPIVYHPAFEEYGCEFVQEPTMTSEVEGSFALRSTTPAELRVIIERTGTDQGLRLSPVEGSDEYRFNYSLWSDGLFEIHIQLRPAGSTVFEFTPVADLRLQSPLAPDTTIVWWRAQGATFPIFLSAYTEVQESWSIEPELASYRRGVLARPITLTYEDLSLEVDAGTPIEFHPNEYFFPYTNRAAVQLAEPLTLPVGGESLTFGPGSLFSFSEFDVDGFIAQPLERTLLGAQVSFPAGSLVKVTSGQITLVLPTSPVAMTLGNSVIPISVYAPLWGLPGEFEIDFFEPATFTLGGADFETQGRTRITGTTRVPTRLRTTEPSTVRHNGQVYELDNRNHATFTGAGAFRSINWN